MEEKYNYFNLRFTIKTNGKINDFDFSSCEKYFALISDEGLNLYELNL